jgi:hypothetical protein
MCPFNQVTGTWVLVCSVFAVVIATMISPINGVVSGQIGSGNGKSPRQRIAPSASAMEPRQWLDHAPVAPAQETSRASDALSMRRGGSPFTL